MNNLYFEMNKHTWLIVLLLTALVWSCSENAGGSTVTKTLYGTWDPILEAADTAKVWVTTTENYLITVSGKCEEIEVTKTEKGDLANPDEKMTDAKCFGDRDQLSFMDPMYRGLRYDLKLDASKDTLIGTMSTLVDGQPDPHPFRIKLLRVGS